MRPNMERVRYALTGWRELNEVAMNMTEVDVQRALEIELARNPSPRESMVRRLRQRLFAIRGQILREEISEEEEE